jgi:hypothetical protein
MTNLYTINDVRHFLKRRLGRAIPDATIKRWKRVVEVTPERIDGEYLYSMSDINALVTLGKWLRTPGNTIKAFKRHYQLGETNHG